MSFITQLGKVLFGSNIKPNTGDQHTDKVSHQVYEQGVMLLSQGNYQEALNHFKKAASFGHISAKYNLALMLFNGLGDYPDFELACKLFQEAKNAGHTRCDEFLSFMQAVDEIFSEELLFEELVCHPIFIINGEFAIKKLGANLELQSGEIIYFISRYFLSRLKINDVYIKIFLGYNREFLDEDVFDLGNLIEEEFYDPNLNMSWVMEFFGGQVDEITYFVDSVIWKNVKDNFDYEDYELHNIKFKIVREVIKQIFPYNIIEV
ncbi:hypothetical protein V2H90_08250 [Glaesserella parasuis]|uniref:tetratricopeptide repeat protein n=1 Tax=Glaesserella parasuis TaxID=738 RepID=UPI002EBB280A|nr:hypothetical protein [Glaesserella parasuis]